MIIHDADYVYIQMYFILDAMAESSAAAFLFTCRVILCDSYTKQE